MSSSLRTTPGRLRLLIWRAPETWAIALSALAWVAIVGPGIAAPRHLLGETGPHPAVTALTHSMTMSVAMMTPLVAPILRWVSLSSLWSRRYVAALQFWTAYIAIWTGVTFGLVVVVDGISALAGRGVVVAATAGLASMSYLSARRARRLVACTRTRPLAPDGVKADRDCRAYGVEIARVCVTTCWAPMALSVAAHGALGMAVVTAALFHERSRRRVPRWQRTAIVGAMWLLALASLW